MDWNVLYSNVTPPTWEQITEYIGSPLWAEFNERIQFTYRTRPCMEYSRCSMQARLGILSIKKVESHFVRSIRCKAILSLSWL